MNIARWCMNGKRVTQVHPYGPPWGYLLQPAVRAPMR